MTRTTLKPLFQETTVTDYFNGVLKTEAWLNDLAIASEEGLYWQDKGGKISLDLYSGATGVILFYIQLYQETKNPTDLQIAEKTGLDVVHRLTNPAAEDNVEAPLFATLANADNGFYLGNAGIAFVLIALAKVSDKPIFKRIAHNLTEKIVNQAIKTEHGVKWTGATGIIFDSGTLLFLVTAADYFNQPEWTEVAIQAGHEILSTAVNRSDDEVIYYGLPNETITPFFGLDPSVQYEFPNFEYGTAGAGYTFARLYEISGQKIFLDEAIKAANHVTRIATHIHDQAALIPYRFPDQADVYYLGFCHGPVGTARLYYKLWQITQDTAYLEWAEKLARGIIEAQAPQEQSLGYWRVQSQCCGTAAFIELFLGLYAATQKSEYLDYAKCSGDKILSEATVVDDKASWFQQYSRIDPEIISQEIGYSSGAAGIGTALLHLVTALKGTYQPIRLSDDPFI
ncbi:hypothetical protein RyT2_05660 [Pseudolactococcus yaeyamensis]